MAPFHNLVSCLHRNHYYMQTSLILKMFDRQFEKKVFLPNHFCCHRYMKGRVTYDQLNAAVQSINTAVIAKYKILHQPMKSLNNVSRTLHQRFKDQETKDTKGITVLCLFTGQQLDLIDPCSPSCLVISGTESLQFVPENY